MTGEMADSLPAHLDGKQHNTAQHSTESYADGIGKQCQCQFTTTSLDVETPRLDPGISESQRRPGLQQRPSQASFSGSDLVAAPSLPSRLDPLSPVSAWGSLPRGLGRVLGPQGEPVEGGNHDGKLCV